MLMGPTSSRHSAITFDNLPTQLKQSCSVWIFRRAWSPSVISPIQKRARMTRYRSVAVLLQVQPTISIL